MKYKAKLHLQPNTNNPIFIGVVEAKNIKELKEEARKKAILWGARRSFIHLECENTQREWTVRV